MNKKNNLGLDICFMNEDDPFKVFKQWMSEAEKNEINDPNAVALATVNEFNQPDVRMVLLKEFNNNGFIFFTNLDSKKGSDLKKIPKASMCFHWKSLLRQVRISGEISLISDKEADEYFNSRPYLSRIGAWSSNQSKPMETRDAFLNRIEKYKNKFTDQNNVPRPNHWSGFMLSPKRIEFWKDVEGRLHQRLEYLKELNSWKKNILYP
ncbi:pyridoxamine 5'-phosphate oxidase [Candidatus Pelagibacter sp.]|nr:pyridoxamine 5'-phosphate oxidase [Candidatus Pelagibacter sp.]